MKLSFCTDSLGNFSFEEMLGKLLSLDIHFIEITTGGWSPAPHIDIDSLLTDISALNSFKQALESRGMKIAALNCSGNPLDPGSLGKEHRAITEKLWN